MQFVGKTMDALFDARGKMSKLTVCFFDNMYPCFFKYFISRAKPPVEPFVYVSG
jgi:hypothetical protein